MQSNHTAIIPSFTAMFDQIFLSFFCPLLFNINKTDSRYTFDLSMAIKAIMYTHIHIQRSALKE